MPSKEMNDVSFSYGSAKAGSCGGVKLGAQAAGRARKQRRRMRWGVFAGMEGL